MFPCKCAIHEKINHYRSKGSELQFEISDPFCALDPNPNRSNHPVFVARECEFTKPIEFSRENKPRTKEDYIREVAKFGVYGRYASTNGKSRISKKDQKYVKVFRNENITNWTTLDRIL